LVAEVDVVSGLGLVADVNDGSGLDWVAEVDVDSGLESVAEVDVVGSGLGVAVDVGVGLLTEVLESTSS
jgi:hypothetical protein